jgi:hypothetical protein
MWRKVLAGGATLAVLVAGCSAAGHLKMLDPPPTPASRPLPSTARMQLGVDIDAYTYPGQDIGAAAEQDIAYVESLHANAVSISFPFFMTGRLANSVHAGPATPSRGGGSAASCRAGTSAPWSVPFPVPVPPAEQLRYPAAGPRIDAVAAEDD